jgi:hypothetical protein
MKISMSLKSIVFLSIICFNSALLAQDGEFNPPMSKEKYQENYNKRIQQSQISGQYIPKDLPDAIAELNKLTEASSRQKFAAMTEAQAEHKLYFSLGRWMCTNWGFYEGSRLSHYLKEVNISFPEDQAIAVILAWHRTLNNKPIDFKQIRDKLVEKRKKEREERLKNATIIKEETKKGSSTDAIKH